VSSPSQTAQVRYRCPAAGQGSTTEIFNFEGADVKGAGNVASIEVIFSPTQGPGQDTNSCHFLFVPNMLYLDGAAGGNTWPNKSPIAPADQGGLVLDNKICSIDATQSSYSLTQDPYILNLNLVIDFYNLGTSYMYEIVENSQGLFSAFSTWTYYGSWSNH
jgi:hypothetical protein